MACKTCGGKTAGNKFAQQEALRNQRILAAAKASNGGTNIVGGASSVKSYQTELARQQANTKK